MTSTRVLLIFAIVIATQSEINEGARILGIFPLPGKSHAILGEQIMKVLAKKGHNVDVISHFPMKNKFPNYNDLSLQGSAEVITNNLNYSMVKTVSINSIKQLLDMTGDPVCNLLHHNTFQNIIKNPPKDPPYDLVIVEYFTAYCFMAFGRLLNVPIIGVTASVLLEWHNDAAGNPHSLAFVPGGMTGFSTKMTFSERLQNTIFSKMMTNDFNRQVESQKLFVDKYIGSGYPSIYDLTREMSLILVNSHYSLNGIRPFTPGVIEIGGVHVQDNEEKLLPELQKWLDEAKHGFIYVSFGSMVRLETFPKKTLDIFYSSFKKISPVRVLMKIAKKEELPPGLPANVKTYHWLPQIQILKHKNVKGFVSHGGLLSTIESIYYAVPIIGFPLFGDQNFNMRNYENRKIAITLNYDSFTEEQLDGALNKILKDPEMRNNIEKLSKLYKDRPMTPQETVAFWVEYVLRHGPVLRSPAVNLSWWQVELLDVYGFILLVLLLALFVILLLIRILIKSIFSSNNKSNSEKLRSKKTK
ncbi:UDP-glycosyltransferase UGT5-like [Leptopilina heterotoma]|uniref:UDP-glycosyltransferase UGT5-like n=1 Tax=Leptopilina heterotoma TaxID=63436 RepID=UPI001CA85CB4|nr:UDP-glycosyltransferase UGT5-like [Leptopilina heterotoma]XP_043467686.1 UDP-glycosyltransferase UGT5-like [Leptopilina heterotoma]